MSDDIIKVLMVEDNPDHAYISKQCLEMAGGFFVKIVHTYECCVQSLQEEYFDVILLDHELPQQDGLTILKRLKKDKNVQAPIVVVTGHGHEQLAVEAMKAGAFDYVVKTMEYPSMLPEVVTRATDKYKISKEKWRIQKELRIRNKELRVLKDISEVVNQSLVLEEILKGAVEKVIQLLTLDAGAIFLLDESSGKLDLKVHQGLHPEILNTLKDIERDGEEFSEAIQIPEQPTYFNDLSKTRSTFSETLVKNKINSIISVPLKYKGHILGVLVLGSKRKDAFTPRQENLLLSIGNQISIAIENAKLYLQTEKFRQFNENIIDSSLDLIITLKYDGTIRFFNKRFEEISGYMKSEIYGKNFLEFIPENQKPFLATKFEEVKQGTFSIYEAEIIKADKNIINCLISQSPLKGEDGFLMVIKDVSKIIDLQKQLIQSEKLSALGKMISGVAHELNNPLAGILGYTQLLLEENLNEANRRDVEVILKEANRCQKIIRNLLTFARNYKSERQHINVNELVKSVLELRQYQLQVDSIDVVKEFNEALPNITGDIHQLQQVFLNLINNAHYALKSVDKKNKQLVVRTELCRDKVRIKVIDNGIGISPEDQLRIFDPFFTTREVGQGTGLGLSICFGIVKSHHGNLYVESGLGKGSTFVVELPVIAVEEEQPHGSKKTAQEERQYLNVNFKKPKEILIVDDEEVIIDLVKRILQKEGCEVKGVFNGEEALREIQKHEFDIVICDIKMPQMNGEVFYTKLKEINPGLLKKLIFTTGDVISSETRNFLKESNQLCLAKPFKTKELVEIINRI
jgi:two-component system NtrC family sensor kinase